MKAKNVYDSFYYSILTREAFGALNCEFNLQTFTVLVSKDSRRVLLTACDMSSVHCLMQILTAFLFIFWCVRVSVYVTSEMPSNDKPSWKDLESLLESKLKPIHSRLDDLFKRGDDNYKALKARLDSLEARNASSEAENAKLVSKLQFCEASLNNLEQYSRRECVEISGIPETEDENTKEISIKVGSLIGVHITERDLSVGHRLPKQSYRDVVREGSQASSNSRVRAPNVVVKFVRRELREISTG